MLNGTIIGVSCCLLLQDELVGRVEVLWKGGPLSLPYVEMKGTGRPTPNMLSIASRASQVSWSPDRDTFLSL